MKTSKTYKHTSIRPPTGTNLKNIEKNVSGENNKIINYQIDYEKTHQNAGGGIETEVFINGNRDFRIRLLVDKSQNKYSVGTSVVSKELANFLEQ